MKREKHIAALKAMIRQNEKDMARMKQLLHELDDKTESRPGQSKGRAPRNKDGGK